MTIGDYIANRGIIYMAFGSTSAIRVKKSIHSLRKAGILLPTLVVGYKEVSGSLFIPWIGHSPYPDDKEDPDQRFRAGYVKPFLYQLSPFKETLYLDADTLILKDIMPGFDNLVQYHICAAYGTPDRTIGRSLGHWNRPKFSDKFWNPIRQELRYTCKTIGKTTSIMNSGVIFFTKNPNTRAFFNEWYTEWYKFKGWEEQLAFLRAERLHPETKILHLDMQWNQKHPDENTIIWHEMGKGSARDEKDTEE